MNENASVHAELKKQDEQWWEGVLEGATIGPHPNFWQDVPLSKMSVKERGAVFGILLLENERHYR